MYFRDPLTPEQRKQLDDYKAQANSWSGYRYTPPHEFGDRPSDIVGGIAIFFIALVLGFVALALLIDDETNEQRLRATTSCDEVLDIMARAGRDAGVAELAHVRYDELGCGL